MGNSKKLFQLDSVCRAVVGFCYEYYVLVGLLSLIAVFFVGFLQYKNTHRRDQHPPAWYDTISYVHMRRRYADFIVVRLVMEIERIEDKYLKCGNILEETLVKAHEEMRLAVELFRNDARKLLAPNELEITMPMELVYGITDDEERLLQSRCRSRNFRIDDRFLNALLRATTNSSD